MATKPATSTTPTPKERLDSVDVSSKLARHKAVAAADVAAATGDVDHAVEICRRVLTIDGENREALALLVRTLTRAGRHADAVAFLDVVLAHFRGLQDANTVVHALLQLQARGFQPKGMLDVGAYHGEFTMLARQVFPGTAVLMVEPQPQKLAFLEMLAKDLGGDCHARSCLCGDGTKGEALFHQLSTPFGSTGSSIYPEASSFPRQAMMLPMRAVDQLVAELPGRVFDLVKIDVQGAELDVLRGASATLANVEVLILELSLHVVNHGGPLLAEVVAAVDTLGFRMFDLQTLPRTDGLLLQVDGIFVRKDSALWQRG